MMIRSAVAILGGLSTLALSGCYDDYGDYYDPYYEDPYSYGDPYGEDPYAAPVALQVEAESFDAVVQGTSVRAPEHHLVATGEQSAQSTYFVIRDGRDRTDGLEVVLDVCPIEEYATGEPVSDPDSSWLNFYVCRGELCRDGWEGDVDVQLADDETGARRVLTTVTWPDGDRAELTLRYVLP